MPSAESWLPIPGWEGLYEVSSHGRVRSLDRSVHYPGGWSVPMAGRVLKQRLSTNGYPYVSLTNGARRETARVHRLVAHAFHGEPEPGHFALHRDDVKTNNTAENIRWGSPSDNNYDAVRNGRNHLAAKTHCAHGHEFNEANTYVRATGGRVCRQCRAEGMARMKTKRKALTNEGNSYVR